MKIANTRRMKGVILFGRPLGWFNVRDRLNYRGLSLGKLFHAATDDRGGWSVSLLGVRL